MEQLNNVHNQYIGALLCAVSEMDVGDLHVALYLQHVNLTEGLQAVEEVEQVLPVHKHLKPLVPTTNRHLRNTRQKSQAAANPQSVKIE